MKKAFQDLLSTWETVGFPGELLGSHLNAHPGNKARAAGGKSIYSVQTRSLHCVLLDGTWSKNL